MAVMLTTSLLREQVLEKEAALQERERIECELRDLQERHAELEQQQRVIASAGHSGAEETAALAQEQLQDALRALDLAHAHAKEQQERAECAALDAQQQRQQVESQLQQAEAHAELLRAQLSESVSKAADDAGAKEELRQLQREVEAAQGQLEESRFQQVALEEKVRLLQEQLKAAQRRADDVATTVEAELTSKISELNDKCARFYQDREDARESLSDAKAVAAVYKKTLSAAMTALKSPAMAGREASASSEEVQKFTRMFSAPASEGSRLKDAEGAVVSLLVEEVEQAVVEALELVATRSTSWQEARRVLEADVAKGEKRARQIQDKLDAKQKEVVNLLEALKAAEHDGANKAARGDSSRRQPEVRAENLPRVLHRVWAGNVGWVLLSGMGAEGESDWFCESAARTSFATVEGSAKYDEALERAGAPVVLDELPMRERKVAQLTASVEKKQQELTALQEEYRAYKIKAHTVLRKKEAAAPERDEDAEAARRRGEVQSAVEKEREKMMAKVRDAQDAAATAREDAAAAERKAADADHEVRVQLDRAQLLEEKVGRLEEQVSIAAQRERERDLEMLNERRQREADRQQDREEWMKEMERERGHERTAYGNGAASGAGEANRGTGGGDDGEAVQVLRRRVASLEQQIESAQQEQQSALRALETSKEKAQAMLLDKDAVISSLRARLKGVADGADAAGDLASYGENGDATRSNGWSAGADAGPLLVPDYEGMFREGGEKTSDTQDWGDDLVGRQLYFAPLERSSVERRASAELQEDHILHVAQMQAQQSEFVSSLQEKISILKDNVSEGKRLQDLLCKERDQLREALEVMKREADSTKRLERYNSKFREGTNIEYLKNVLLKYIETQDHEGLIPVLSSVLEFDADEQRRLHAAQSRMSSPWSKLGTRLGGGLF